MAMVVRADFPLRRVEAAGEGEQPLPGFLEAVGHRLALQPPFAKEGSAALLDRLAEA